MAFTKVGSGSRLSPGEVMEVKVGDKPYAICNVDGQLEALEGTCPHRGGPLGHGALHGETLVCPWHAWEFNCRTGKDVTGGPGVAKVAVKTEGDDILIDVD